MAPSSYTRVPERGATFRLTCWRSSVDARRVSRRLQACVRSAASTGTGATRRPLAGVWGRMGTISSCR